VEYASHPRIGETSWQNTLAMMIAAPDPESSYIYVMTASRLARLLKPYDAPHADRLADSARRAWEYAEANAGTFTKRFDKRFAESITRVRAGAAVELLRLTRDPAIGAIAKDALTQAMTPVVSPEAQPAVFAYAIAPDDITDPVLKAACRKAIIEAAVSATRTTRRASAVATGRAATCRVGSPGWWVDSSAVASSKSAGRCRAGGRCW